MELTFGIVVFAYLTFLAVLLSYVNFTKRTNFTLPGGYGVPSGLLVLGAGLYMFNDHGLATVLKSVASGIFIGFVFYLMEAKLDIDPDDPEEK